MENIKTLWQLLQEVVENDDDKRYSLHEFLLESTDDDRKRIAGKLADANNKQFYEYMDGFDFVNEQEIYCACCEYAEHTMQRPLCMGEMCDISELADDYMSERGISFDDF